jgi:aryl-alcohol dehydrogenase-like predicted oxidoreductase
MERRPFGNTTDSLSLVGLGGVAFVGLDQPASNDLVAEAIDNGVNYFDVAPSYGHEQETEKRLGPALRPYRDQAFLACKTAVRTGAGAAEELERSLRYLETDYFDLYQLHAITSLEDVETAFAPGGAMDVIVAARDAGKIRHIGFSAHSVEAAFAALDRFPFASALFPVNFVTYQQGNFGPQIVQRCIDAGAARLALKAMARPHWVEGAPRSFPNCWYEPIADKALAEIALRFTLSESVTAAVPPGDPRLWRWAVEFAQRFTPLTEDERAYLATVAEDLQPIFKA